MVTTDASKTGLGITLWQKQDNGEMKPIAFGSRYLNDTEKNYSIGELELLAVVWGLEKLRFFHTERMYIYTQTTGTFNKTKSEQPPIYRKTNEIAIPVSTF